MKYALKNIKRQLEEMQIMKFIVLLKETRKRGHGDTGVNRECKANEATIYLGKEKLQHNNVFN